MIPKECKRLAEVDFPIAVVSKHAAREKSIRHGHPSTLHLWWARRPLAACRAMLLALLLPDPDDEQCPDEFKKRARELLPRVVGEIKPKDRDLRQALLKFIGDFANWISQRTRPISMSRADSSRLRIRMKPRWSWTRSPAEGRFPWKPCASDAKPSRAI